jgi:hypothetical protein
LLDEHRSPTYAAPLGLLLYGARYDKSTPTTEGNFVGEMVEAIGDILGGLFNRKP